MFLFRGARLFGEACNFQQWLLTTPFYTVVIVVLFLALTRVFKSLKSPWSQHGFESNSGVEKYPLQKKHVMIDGLVLIVFQTLRNCRSALTAFQGDTRGQFW